MNRPTPKEKTKMNYEVEIISRKAGTEKFRKLYLLDCSTKAKIKISNIWTTGVFKTFKNASTAERWVPLVLEYLREHGHRDQTGLKPNQVRGCFRSIYTVRVAEVTTI